MTCHGHCYAPCPGCGFHHFGWDPWYGYHRAPRRPPRRRDDEIADLEARRADLEARLAELAEEIERLRDRASA